MATESEFSPGEGLPALVEWVSGFVVYVCRMSVGYVRVGYLLFKQLEKTVSDVEEAAAQSYEISALTDGNIISICLHHM